jgi:peroxiredoxin
LAEYARHTDAIRGAGADIAALSVDAPARSEGVRAQLGLRFPLLCDPARRVVREWDLYNAKEMGGIAYPAVFVIGPDRRVRYRSIDRTASRVSTEGVLRFLRGEGTADPPERRRVRAGLREFGRAFANALRRGLRTPPE